MEKKNFKYFILCVGTFLNIYGVINSYFCIGNMYLGLELPLMKPAHFFYEHCCAIIGVTGWFFVLSVVTIPKVNRLEKRTLWIKVILLLVSFLFLSYPFFILYTLWTHFPSNIVFWNFPLNFCFINCILILFSYFLLARNLFFAKFDLKKGVLLLVFWFLGNDCMYANFEFVVNYSSFLYHQDLAIFQDFMLEVLQEFGFVTGCSEGLVPLNPRRPGDCQKIEDIKKWCDMLKSGFEVPLPKNKISIAQKIGKGYCDNIALLKEICQKNSKK